MKSEYQLHAISDKDRSVKLFYQDSKRPVMQHKIHNGYVRSLKFLSPSYLISGGDDKKVAIYDADVQKGILERNFLSRVLGFDHNNRMDLLITAISSNQIAIDQLSCLEAIDAILIDGRVTSTSWLDNNRILVTGEEEAKARGFVKIFDLRNTKNPYKEKFFDEDIIQGAQYIDEENIVAHSDSVLVIFCPYSILAFGR